MVVRKLLKQALGELIVLKNRVHDPSRFLGHLYVAALEEWAERLSVHPIKLNKVVTIRDGHLKPLPSLDAAALALCRFPRHRPANDRSFNGHA